MSHVATLHLSLGQDIEMLRDTVNKFAMNEIAPRAAAIEEENLFPHDLWRKFGDLGVLGLTVSGEYGGAQLGYLAHMVAMEEISRASAAVGLSYGAHQTCASTSCIAMATPNKRQSICPNLYP